MTREIATCSCCCVNDGRYACTDCCLACGGKYYNSYSLTVTTTGLYAGCDIVVGTFTLVKTVGPGCKWVSTALTPPDIDGNQWPIWVIEWSSADYSGAFTLGYYGSSSYPYNTVGGLGGGNVYDCDCTTSCAIPIAWRCRETITDFNMPGVCACHANYEGGFTMSVSLSPIGELVGDVCSCGTCGNCLRNCTSYRTVLSGTDLATPTPAYSYNDVSGSFVGSYGGLLPDNYLDTGLVALTDGTDTYNLRFILGCTGDTWTVTLGDGSDCTIVPFSALVTSVNCDTGSGEFILPSISWYCQISCGDKTIAVNGSITCHNGFGITKPVEAVAAAGPIERGSVAPTAITGKVHKVEYRRKPCNCAKPVIDQKYIEQARARLRR